MVLSAACLDLTLGPVSPSSPHCQHPGEQGITDSVGDIFLQEGNHFIYYQDRFATGRRQKLNISGSQTLSHQGEALRHK